MSVSDVIGRLASPHDAHRLSN